VRQPQQVVAGGPARLQRGGVEQRPHLRQRAPQALVRLAVDKRGARLGGVQAEDHPHRGGLPGPVGAYEAGDLAGGDGEGHPVQRERGAEPLTHTGHLDGGSAHAIVLPRW